MKRLLLSLALTCLLPGCGPALNASSGDDQKRSGALQTGPVSLHHDRVSRDDGDATDWKKFTVTAAGTAMKFDIWWDDPEVEATVTLQDVFGATHATLKHARGKRAEGWPAVPVPPGDWFLRIHSTNGSSVYTLAWAQVSAGGGGKPVRAF